MTTRAMTRSSPPLDHGGVLTRSMSRRRQVSPTVTMTTTQQQPTFGITRRGTYCKRCIKMGRYCYQHVHQDPSSCLPCNNNNSQQQSTPVVLQTEDDTVDITMEVPQQQQQPVVDDRIPKTALHQALFQPQQQKLARIRKTFVFSELLQKSREQAAKQLREAFLKKRDACLKELVVSISQQRRSKAFIYSQKTALKDYTGKGYEAMNAALRQMTIDGCVNCIKKGDDWVPVDKKGLVKKVAPDYSGVAFQKGARKADKKDVEGRIQHLLRGLSDRKTLPVYQGTVYRGSKWRAEWSYEMQTGAIFADRGFLSTSTDDNIAKNFKANANGDGVFFEIVSKTGQLISGSSKHEHEAEVLFRPNTMFRILSVDGPIQPNSPPLGSRYNTTKQTVLRLEPIQPTNRPPIGVDTTNKQASAWS
ncbi:expressed unknown protein [Seminavis robusta]|uniref:NAD(P)(+)--arginine ADP-ribosyltransferase n=1 Tax=Seminavis robusta TaxID=568900 RepID=A0A9N8DHM4_9STRA|nr:expressed unknown protein [Seminavis robusta]|eukprot:Sro132_g062660.1 n/a (418) ;mRNA; r:69046-70984